MGDKFEAVGEKKRWCAIHIIRNIPCMQWTPTLHCK